MIRKFSILILATCLYGEVNAQSPNEKIQNGKINFEFLEELFLKKLNTYRQSLSLGILTTDPILKQAATDQAMYQQKIGKLSHFQEPNSKKYSPAQRVLFYNGTHDQVGENCLVTYIGGPVRDSKTGTVAAVETYDEAAQDLFAIWKNSPPHHENMITRNYECSGMGFTFNAKTGQLYAVEVFGAKPFTKPSIELAYNNSTQGVADYDEKACNCLQNLEFVSTWLANYTQISGDSVFITSTSLPVMEKLFANANDGMAIDLVYREQFNCGLNHNLHGSSVFDGYMLKPVYRDELMARNRHKAYGAMYSFVCTIPAQAIKKGLQVNTILIKKGRACSYSYPVEGIAGELPNVLIDPRWCFYEGRLEKGHVAFTKKIDFPFEQNSATPFATDLIALDRLLLQFDGAIKKIHIVTYSSIEGDAEVNRVLQEKRLSFLQNSITHTLTQKPDMVSSSKENWDLFYHQIKNTEWESTLEGKSQEEIRTVINKNIHDNFIRTSLEQQRVATVEFEIEKDYDDNIAPSLLHIPLYDAIRKGDSVQARIASSKLVRAFNSGLISIDKLSVVDVPLEKKYLHVISNTIASKILLGDMFGYNDMEDPASIVYIQQAFEKFPDFVPLKFNKLIWFTHLFYHNLLQDPQEFARLGTEIKKFENSADIDPKTYESLLFNYYLTGSIFYYKHVLYNNAYDCLHQTKPFLIKGQLKEEEILNVSKYFNRFFDYQTSIGLLEDGLKRFPENNDILFLYVSTGIFYNLTYEKETDLYFSRVDLYRQRKSKEFCNWIEKNYQLIREPKFKERFCRYCP